LVGERLELLENMKNHSFRCGWLGSDLKACLRVMEHAATSIKGKSYSANTARLSLTQQIENVRDTLALIEESEKC
jgi:hypothetical protein